MNYIKLKIFVGFFLIHSIDQICCETITLEDTYETGRAILLSITSNHDNITNFFAEINKEYNHLSNIYNDQNDRNIDNFIKLSKEQTVSEVNILAHNLNKFSLDEQLKYENFIRANTNTFKEKMPIVDNCFKNNNSLNEILRCIDQYQSSKNMVNYKKDYEFYAKTINLFNAYNFLLISTIKEHERSFIATTNEIISIAKNKNNEFIQRKLSISTPSTNQNNQNLMLSISGTKVNDTLKNLYVNQKKWINTANLINWMAIQAMSSNITLNYISKINDNDKKNFQSCFDHSKVQLNKAIIIAVNYSNKCVDDEMLNLNNLIFSENKEQEAAFFTCFYNNARPEDIFVCMGVLQSSNYAPKILKLSYNDAVNKFIKNQQFLSDKLLDCSYKSRDDFKQHVKHLNNQFDMCTQNQKSSEKSIIE